MVEKYFFIAAKNIILYENCGLKLFDGSVCIYIIYGLCVPHTTYIACNICIKFFRIQATAISHLAAYLDYTIHMDQYNRVSLVYAFDSVIKCWFWYGWVIYHGTSQLQLRQTTTLFLLLIFFALNFFLFATVFWSTLIIDTHTQIRWYAHLFTEPIKEKKFAFEWTNPLTER